jgi:hypothetical protein
LTQPLIEEYQEYLLGCKGGRCVGLTTLPPSCAHCLGIWESQITTGISEEFTFSLFRVVQI